MQFCLVKNLLKILVTYNLSALFITAIVHIDIHPDQYNSGYSICDIDCENQIHHSISHQCEKCLHKHHRIGTLIKFDFSIDEKTSDFVISNDIIYVKSIIYDLHSRPPPNLI